MIEEKFKILEANILKLLVENKELKAELVTVKASLNQCQAESTETIRNMQDVSTQAIEILQAESTQALELLQAENTMIQSRNAELTMHLKKIMSRLESLGVQ